MVAGGVPRGARKGEHGVRPTDRPTHQPGAARLHPALRSLQHHREGDLQEVEPRRAHQGRRQRGRHPHAVGAADQELLVNGADRRRTSGSGRMCRRRADCYALFHCGKRRGVKLKNKDEGDEIKEGEGKSIPPQ